MSKVRLPQQRRNHEAGGLRRELDAVIARAKLVEEVQSGTKTEFWAGYLKPLLRAQVDGFVNIETALEIDPKEFASMQNTARVIHNILERVDSLEKDDLESLKDSSQRLLTRVEEAEKEGLIEKEIIG